MGITAVYDALLDPDRWHIAEVHDDSIRLQHNDILYAVVTGTNEVDGTTYTPSLALRSILCEIDNTYTTGFYERFNSAIRKIAVALLMQQAGKDAEPNGS